MTVNDPACVPRHRDGGVGPGSSRETPLLARVQVDGVESAVGAVDRELTIDRDARNGVLAVGVRQICEQAGAEIREVDLPVVVPVSLEEDALAVPRDADAVVPALGP